MQVRARQGPGRIVAGAVAAALCAAASVRALEPTSASAPAITELRDAPPPRANPDALLLAWRTLDSTSGLPQLTVLALAQDTRGYVYAGTKDGLARYDGRRFEPVALGAAMYEAVTHLHTDAHKRLWIGSDEGLFLLDDAPVREVRQRDGRRMPAIEAFADASAGVLWAGTPQGLFHCEPTGCDAIPAGADLEVAELLEGTGPNGPCLWLGTNLDGLYRLDRNGTALVRSDFHLGRDEGLPNSAVRALAEFGGDGARPSLWIGTGRGLARLDGTTLTVYGAAQGFPRGSVLALRERIAADGSRVLLAAGYGGGLIEIAPDGSYRVLGMAEGLPEAYLFSVLVTGSGREAITWLGSASTGVLRLEPGRFRAFDERHGLPQRAAMGVGESTFPDGVRALWVGTLGGSVRLEDGRWRAFLPAPYRDWVVSDVLHDPRGRLWVATTRGLLLVEDGRVREFTSDNSALPAVAADQLAWRGDTLWIATGHGIGRFRDGRLEAPFENDDKLALIAVGALLEVEDVDGASRLLMGSDAGLLDASGERPLPLAAPCLAHPQVIALAHGSGRTFWAGTQRGAARLRLERDGLRCDALHEGGDGARVVHAITRDASGRIYLFGYDGVRRLADPDEPLDGPQRFGLERFGLEDGLPSLEFNRDAHLDGAGRVWAANSAGLVVFDPAQERVETGPAPLVLEARLGEQPLGDAAVLASDHSELSFSYRLLSFRDEHRIRYRTQLLGLESRAGGWSPQVEKRYVRLPAGEYRFRVRARDGSGREHGPVEHVFRVAPAWWQQRPVLALAIVTLLGLGLAAGRWRASALAARASVLERQVEERTQALADTNRELERASNSDALTGAWNRRYFYARVGGWAREAAGAGGLLLMLVDIDHFKQINDRHGHAVGDTVLVEVARRLAALDGARGELIRWGGEEFLLIVRRAGEVDAPALARAALAAIAATPVAVAGSELAVRASIGFTICRPPAEGVDTHIDTIVARADQALYHAKSAGRAQAVGAAIDPRDGRVVFTGAGGAHGPV